MAGLFYNWSFNITTGLAKIDDRSYLKMMQVFNKSILNPAFILIFIGSILTFPFLTFLQGKIALNLSFWFVLSAMVIYIVGSICVTFWGNVPMNNELEALNLIQLTSEECYTFRKVFEIKWNTLNLIRTISSLISIILLLIPIFIKTGK